MLSVQSLLLGILATRLAKCSYAFVPATPSSKEIQNVQRSEKNRLRTKLAWTANGNYDADESNDEQTRLFIHKRLVQAALQTPDDLQSVEWVGQANLPGPTTKETVECLVLKPASVDFVSNESPHPYLVVPLPGSSQLLQSLAPTLNNTLSRWQLLQRNMELVNRDNGLFDNLPYAEWDASVKDAANNPVASQFHMGKRACYQTLTGKNWFLDKPSYKRLAKSDDGAVDDSRIDPSITTLNDNSLAQRILETTVRELQMKMAECDAEIAVARVAASTENQETEKLAYWKNAKATVQKDYEDAKTRLESVSKNYDWSVASLIERFISSRDQQGDRKGRVASSSAGLKGMSDDSYSSPFHMVLTILSQYLKARVLGTVLENTSALDGTVTIGGVLVLQREKKTMTIMGETLAVDDAVDGIDAGEIYLVECLTDEAIGMSIASETHIYVESSIVEPCSVMVKQDQPEIPLSWKAVDSKLSILYAEQANNQSATERVHPIRLERNMRTISWDSLTQPQSFSRKDSAQLFPSDNPVTTLAQFDAMSSDDKVRTLLTMSNFEGSVPRPRSLRSNAKVLDDLLLPLVDERVRTQYLIRDAERRGDTAALAELTASKSKRLIATEKACAARDTGQEDTAKAYDEEAEFYESLRADVTQDEGSYSRFLDRDDWYEENRRRATSKIDKSKFGTLLD